MTELDSKLHQRITRFCEIGDDLAERGDFLQAIDAYRYARCLLPEPQAQWEAATWIAAAIGDAHFLAGHFKAARDVLHEALSGNFPDALGNPFIHLRLGQAEFELGNQDRAADELMRAYMGAGKDIFADEDGKYLAFLASRAKDIDTELP